MEIEDATVILSFVLQQNEPNIKKTYDVEQIGLALDVAFVNGSKDLVKSVVDKVVNMYPSYGRILRIKAILLAENDRAQDAIYLLSLVAGDDPYLLSCVELIGVIYVNGYHFEKALTTYNVLLTQVEDEDNKAVIYEQRALCYLYLKQNEAAILDLIAAIEIMPYWDEFYNEIPLNLKYLLSEKPRSEVQHLIVSLEKMCYDAIDICINYGPYFVLAHLALLDLNVADAERFITYLSDEDLNEPAIVNLKEHVLKMHAFKKLVNNHMALEDNIKIFPKVANRPYYKNGYLAEPPDDHPPVIYRKKIKPYRDQQRAIEIEMEELSELDYLIFKKQNELQRA